VGAGSTRIVWLVLRRAFVQLTAGLAFGVFMLFTLASFFPLPSSFDDAKVLGTVMALIMGVAMTACVVPAVRAARVDPVSSLSVE
jgi:ABC-type lipoprotein release transport system permease subunit